MHFTAINGVQPAIPQNIEETIDLADLLHEDDTLKHSDAKDKADVVSSSNKDIMRIAAGVAAKSTEEEGHEQVPEEKQNMHQVYIKKKESLQQ